MREQALKEEVKERLIKHINFLEAELKDYQIFKSLTWEEYRVKRSKQRDVERWVENIINSCIDMAKIILTSKGISLPDTYREVVASLSVVHGFDKEHIEKLSRWVRFRNIISHEYLDIKWSSIKRFINETKPLYQGFLNKTKEYLETELMGEGRSC